MLRRLPAHVVLLFMLSELGSCVQGQPPPPSSIPPSSSAAPSDGDATALAAKSAPSGASSSAPAVAPVAPAPTSSAAPDRSMDDIRAVVSAHRDAFRGCYEQSLKSHPGIEGAFLLRFVVDPQGSVTSASADPKRSDIHASDLEACAAATVKGLKFPPSRRGMESTVNYPFDFHPRGAGRSAPTTP